MSFLFSVRLKIKPFAGIRGRLGRFQIDKSVRETRATPRLPAQRSRPSEDVPGEEKAPAGRGLSYSTGISGYLDLYIS